MLMVVKAMIKKNDSTLSGRFRTSSIQRSLTFTDALSLLSITMRSLLSKKVTRSNTKPASAKMLMVINQARPASGVLYTASISPVCSFSTLGAKMAITNGKVLITSPAKLAITIRTLVRMVISSVSRVSEEPSAP